MNRRLTLKENVFVFIGSVVFACSPFLITTAGSFLGMVDTTPVPGGMSQADGILLFAFGTLPIGLLVALMSLVGVISQYRKGRATIWE